MNLKLKYNTELNEELPSMEDVTTPEIIDPGILEGRKRKLPTLIAEKVQEKALLFTDGKEKTYAQFEVSDHKETWPINSNRFKSWLYKLGTDLNNGDIPTSENINTVVKYLEALAYEQQEIILYNRVAKLNEEFWYDLTNDKWQAIKINNEEWVVEDNFLPLFIRYTHQKKQVLPTKGGDVWVLFEFIRVPDNKKLLFMVYTIACFIPSIPHPVKILFGPPGSGKSITMEFDRELIDPSQVPKLRMPKGDKEIVQVFDHHYATFFDNLDILSKSFSDIVCRAVTGEGSEHRALYSNDDAIIRNYRRCVCLNGINVPATQVDLLDRSILFELEKFPQGMRVEEEELRKNFELAKPDILGGIFDTLVLSKRIYPSVNIKNPPRMADFAKWGYAIAEALGRGGDEFLKAYLDDQNERVNETIYQNNLAIAIVALMEEHKTWKGTPADLLEELEIVAARKKIQTDSTTWPKNPPWLVRKLNDIQPILELSGISIERSRENRGQRYITLKVEENADNSVMLSNQAGTVRS